MQLIKAKIEENGQVVDIIGHLYSTLQDSIVLVLPEGGQMTIPKDDLVEPIEYLKDEVIELPKQKVEVKKDGVTVVKKLPPLKEGGKLAKVVALCDANPNASRKELIAMIVETGIMTSLAGASTYHQNAKPYLKVNQK